MTKRRLSFSLAATLASAFVFQASSAPQHRPGRLGAKPILQRGGDAMSGGDEPWFAFRLSEGDGAASSEARAVLGVAVPLD
jgi:hypothetical protein